MQDSLNGQIILYVWSYLQEVWIRGKREQFSFLEVSSLHSTLPIFSWWYDSIKSVSAIWYWRNNSANHFTFVSLNFIVIIFLNYSRRWKLANNYIGYGKCASKNIRWKSRMFKQEYRKKLIEFASRIFKRCFEILWFKGKL